MKSEAVSADTALPDTAAYLAAAREAWQAGETVEPLRLKVITASMRPLLQAGDEVIVQSIDPHTLRPGEVLVVQRGGEWITHRLIKVDERGWHTHGDNTRYEDEPASAAEIVGRVIAIERGTQTIDLRQPRWRAIERRINRVQRVRLRVFAPGRPGAGTPASIIRRGVAAAINWPFHLVVRWLTRF